jgi:hypothetical protein
MEESKGNELLSNRYMYTRDHSSAIKSSTRPAAARQSATATVCHGPVALPL